MDLLQPNDWHLDAIYCDRRRDRESQVYVRSHPHNVASPLTCSTRNSGLLHARIDFPLDRRCSRFPQARRTHRVMSAVGPDRSPSVS